VLRHIADHSGNVVGCRYEMIPYTIFSQKIAVAPLLDADPSMVDPSARLDLFEDQLVVLVITDGGYERPS